MRRVIIVAGMGGHFSQAQRFFNAIQDLSDLEVVYWITEEAIVGALTPLRTKNNNIVPFLALPRLVEYERVNLFIVGRNLFRIFKILFKTEMPKSDLIISFGPAFSFPTVIYLKMMKRTEVIHFESWSRFKLESNTTKILRYLGFRICAQNLSQMRKYGKFFYFGRLRGD
ncbi:hypothetical protein [Shewanella sp.]|uniref:hypothetical protein n=1 Tax=Shewanella sp. TaxID=50422 RepID=UPI004047A840